MYHWADGARYEGCWAAGEPYGPGRWTLKAEAAGGGVRGAGDRRVVEVGEAAEWAAAEWATVDAVERAKAAAARGQAAEER